jgi:spore coat polysaccharide biosynthesis protein SpsF
MNEKNNGKNMIGVIIQARMNSSRLPGKVMKKLNNKPMLNYVLEQIRFSKLVKKIIVATTHSKNDDLIYEYVKKKGINIFRGKSKDVLDRYFQCAKKFQLDTIVRITSDCPLIDPEIIDLVIKNYMQGDFDYISNNKPRTFPYGMDVEVFSFKSLKKAWVEASLPSEREHVTPYIYKNLKKFKIKNIKQKKNFSKIRITVDRQNDFELIKNIVNNVKSNPILMKDIIELYHKNQELFKINKNYLDDEGYIKSLNEDKKFVK